MTNQKPKCKLLGEDGNIFYLVGKAGRTLKRNGQTEQAKELYARIPKCHSYDEALDLIEEYVEIC